MEAEKYLAELEDEDGLENNKEVKKGEINGGEKVPEYRSNPLL